MSECNENKVVGRCFADIGAQKRFLKLFTWKSFSSQNFRGGGLENGCGNDPETISKGGGVKRFLWKRKGLFQFGEFETGNL